MSWTTIFDYAAPVVPTYFLYMMMTIVYMNFATDVLLIAPGVIGTIFFVSKIWDAVSDPVVGFLSDRTRSRFGRRQSWMFASALPMAALSVMLWSPPADLGPTPLLVWVIVSVFGFYTTFTIYAVPQLALGAEIDPRPAERARVFGGRQVAVTLGMLASFVLAAPMVLGNPAARENATLLAVGGGTLLALSVLTCTWRLPPERATGSSRGASNPIAAVRDVLRNPHARLLLFVYFIEIFGIGGTSAMTAYLLKYITKAAHLVGPIFLVYTIPTILSIPFWVRLSRRYERHVLWRYAMGIQAIGYGSMLFQDEGRVALMVFSSVVNGFATGCGQSLGQAIKADVIDYDEYETGERKEGAYYATWNLAGKLGTGLMIALSGWALQAAGYQENAVQNQATRWTILFLMGGAPFLCLLVGMAAFSRFSLDSREHARILAAIDERKRPAG